MITREVPNPSLHDLPAFLRNSWIPSAGRATPPIEGIQWTGSGKGALALVLRYLRHTGVLENKLSEVLVPDWLGYWVYNQIQEFAFPAKRLSERTKAILVYHQYGFPQDLDPILAYAHKHGLVVIEDCAHTLAGTYKGKPLGSFGDFAIYSFSKFFFCSALGGVRSKAPDFPAYAKQQILESSRTASFIKDLVKIFGEISLGYGANPALDATNALVTMSYSLYGRALRSAPAGERLACTKFQAEVSLRARRYQEFRHRTDVLRLCEHLPLEGIVPYVIPIRMPAGREAPALRVMSEFGIHTGRYFFDMERNLLNPRFEPTLWVPCHSALSDDRFNHLTAALARTFAASES